MNVSYGRENSVGGGGGGFTTTAHTLVVLSSYTFIHLYAYFPHNFKGLNTDAVVLHISVHERRAKEQKGVKFSLNKHKMLLDTIDCAHSLLFSRSCTAPIHAGAPY